MKSYSEVITLIGFCFPNWTMGPEIIWPSPYLELNTSLQSGEGEVPFASYTLPSLLQTAGLTKLDAEHKT
jgi:hypothetical protein